MHAKVVSIFFFFLCSAHGDSGVTLELLLVSLLFPFSVLIVHRQDRCFPSFEILASLDLVLEEKETTE